MKRKCLAVGIILLFVGTCINPTTAQNTEKTLFSSIEVQWILSDSSRGEIELKYYEEEGLSTMIDVCGPSVWKAAIRLTQDEIAAYADWTLTKVNVAFPSYGECPWINVRLYIYGKGNVYAQPGSLIVNDTTYTLDTAGVTTIPLVTPVNLSGHEELWVAVEWYDIGYGPYAVLDTLTGPAVDGKGDWYYLNNAWGEIQTAGADYDGNWGIGAIVEGEGLTELTIGNIKGPIGVKADVSNTGVNDATNVEWSIQVTGGLLGRVNASATGTSVSLVAGSSLPISVGAFIGFGKISIVITAKAQNSLDASTTKSAFLLGPFVVGIR
jgi:hypothetical protein